MKKFIKGICIFTLIAYGLHLYLSSNDQKEEIAKIVEVQYIEKETDIYEVASELYDIDINLIKAIEILETGNYTSNAYIKFNNTFGAQINGTFLIYDNPEQSTLELARLLRFRYFDEGLDTLEKINKLYCPNDKKWASKVRSIMNELNSNVAVGETNEKDIRKKS